MPLLEFQAQTVEITITTVTILQSSFILLASGVCILNQDNRKRSSGAFGATGFSVIMRATRYNKGKGWPQIQFPTCGFTSQNWHIDAFIVTTGLESHGSNKHIINQFYKYYLSSTKGLGISLNFTTRSRG